MTVDIITNNTKNNLLFVVYISSLIKESISKICYELFKGRLNTFTNLLFLIIYIYNLETLKYSSEFKWNNIVNSLLLLVH